MLWEIAFDYSVSSRIIHLSLLYVSFYFFLFDGWLDKKKKKKHKSLCWAFLRFFKFRVIMGWLAATRSQRSCSGSWERAWPCRSAHHRPVARDGSLMRSQCLRQSGLSASPRGVNLCWRCVVHSPVGRPIRGLSWKARSVLTVRAGWGREAEGEGGG